MREIDVLQKELQIFRDRRNWDQYHAPKNIIMALSGEVGELAKHYQWLCEGEEPIDPYEVRNEIADIFIYLAMLADKLDIDLIEAAYSKMKLNAEKYPVD